MCTILKIRESRLLWLLCSLIIWGCEEEKDPTISNIRIYDLPINAATIVNDGYAILSDSVWFRVDYKGNPSEYHKLPDKDETSFYKYSDIIQVTDGLIILGTRYSIEKEFANLVVKKVSLNGALLDEKELEISDKIDASDLNLINSNFTIQFPIYAKGVVSTNNQLVIAFNCVGEAQQRWKFSLLHLDSELNLILKKDYVSRDFYSWIYKLKKLSDNSFVLTRGGNDWYSIEKFDLSLEIRSYGKTLGAAGAGNPVLSNIIELINGNILFTGHSDGRDNPDNSIVTNYDFWFVKLDNHNSLSEKRIANPLSPQFKNFKELCFDSFLTNNNSLLWVGGQRGYNQTTFDLTSKIKLVETTLEGDFVKETLVSDVGGLEPFVLKVDPVSDRNNIVGRKFKYDGAMQTFFQTIKYD